MCIFSKPLDIVRRTQLIHAWMNGQNGRQYALQTYTNEVRMNAGVPVTAMILPVPTTANRIALLNRDNDKTAAHAFKMLHDRFESEKPQSRSAFGTFGSLDAQGAPPLLLPVVQSGAYFVSVAPTLSDLTRVDPSVFSIDDAALMRTLAATDKTRRHFSYLVFVIRASATFQPFSYMYEVDPDEDGFVPTMHYHPHVALATATTTAAATTTTTTTTTTTFVSSWNSSSSPATAAAAQPFSFGLRPTTADEMKKADDWDHEIFVLGVRDLRVHEHSMQRHITQLRSSCSDICTLLLTSLVQQPTWTIADCAHQLVLHGRHANVDITFPLAQPLLHRGVFCDACKQVLRTGARYKCTTCADLDLCAPCHAAGRATGQWQHDGRAGHPFIELKDLADTAAFQAKCEQQARTSHAIASLEHAIDKTKEILATCKGI